MAPVTSHLFSGPLITRFGAAAVLMGDILTFACNLIAWAILFGAEPDTAVAVVGIMPTDVGVESTFPTVMGALAVASRLLKKALATGIVV